MEQPRRRRFVHGARERRERHRQRNRIIRLVVAIAGFLVVCIGIVLIPLPGPGLLVVAVGLFILALEFAWAERLLERTVDRLEQAAEEVRTSSGPRKVLYAFIGLAGAIVTLAIALLWDVPFLPV
jgi:uncharacterized protein (TIGR02611 family)